jgi:hypothetical protein
MTVLQNRDRGRCFDTNVEDLLMENDVRLLWSKVRPVVMASKDDHRGGTRAVLRAPVNCYAGDLAVFGHALARLAHCRVVQLLSPQPSSTTPNSNHPHGHPTLSS